MIVGHYKAMMNDSLMCFARQYLTMFSKSTVGLPHPHRVLGCQGDPAAVPPVDYRLAFKHLTKERILGNFKHLNEVAADGVSVLLQEPFSGSNRDIFCFVLFYRRRLQPPSFTWTLPLVPVES